jgi:AraC-like DNA-binding protein
MPAPTRGRDTNALWRTGAFSHQRVAATADYHWDNHQRQPAGCCVFQYTVEGVLHYRDRDGEREVPAGHAVLFSFSEASDYWLPPPPRPAYVCEWINLQGAGLVEHWAALRRRYGSVVPLGAEVIDELHRLMAVADPAASNEPTLVAAAVHRFVMRLFADLTRDLAARQSPVERAINAMLDNPLHPWSLGEVAERFACSREHLTRAFTRRLGCPPGAWLAQARLQRALQLINDTALTLTEVARQSGYSSIHTLSRQVRVATGRSPRTLRRGAG